MTFFYKLHHSVEYSLLRYLIFLHWNRFSSSFQNQTDQLRKNEMKQPITNISYSLKTPVFIYFSSAYSIYLQTSVKHNVLTYI